MRWITGITIDNYRVFPARKSDDTDPTIKIDFGKHLLIYGENGSGKSSVYNALRDFFISSDSNPQIPFRKNIFEPEVNNGQIRVKISESENRSTEYIFNDPDSDSTHKVTEIRQPNKIKGFLDYKALLNTHFNAGKVSTNPNLFTLLIENLLSEITLPNSSDKVKDQWNPIKSTILNSTDYRKSDFRNATGEGITNFHRLSMTLLRNLLSSVNELYRKYFEEKLDIVDIQSRMDFDKTQNKLVTEVFFKIKYAGEEVENYQYFLNEARLSALAVCIYFASIKTQPYTATDLRVLFLDDVFIGLDTSNRIPLLEMLRDEFISENYQILISTYDRQWFELARSWFESVVPSEVKSIEMFTGHEVLSDGSGNDDPLKPDYPIILDFLTYIERAKTYLEARDYPAAGNYIRKSCEQALRELLPQNYEIDSNGERIKELEGLKQNLIKFYDDYGLALPSTLLGNIELYQRSLLNPASHDDVKSPLYRIELQKAIQAVEAVLVEPKINITRILKHDTELAVNHTSGDFIAEIRVVGGIFLVEQAGTKNFRPFSCRIVNWSNHNISFGMKQNGTITALSTEEVAEITSKDYSLEKIISMAEHSSGLSFPVPPYETIKVKESGKKLSELLM